MRSASLLALGLLITCLSAGRGDEWPQFRGPGGTGLSGEKQLPAEWGADKNLAWKVAAPGRGWSCPVVWGDKVFLTAASSAADKKGRPGGKQPGGGRPGGFGRPGGGKAPDVMYRFEVVCLDRASGKVLWKETALERKPTVPTHGSNTYASETPVTDGERVYAYFGMHGLFCYDLAGKLLWKKDLGSFPMQMGWGTSSSPVLDGNRLFLQIDNEQKSFLVALDKKTGDELWRVSRSERSTWGTPLVWKNKVRTELVTPGAQKVRSYDPADGKLLWELSLGGGRSSASPVADAERLYVGNGGGGRGTTGGPLYAVKAGASGDITPARGVSTSSGIAWSQPKAGPQMASPLVYRGYLYVLDQNGGGVSCYDAKTGKPAYQRERISGARAFWASPWAYDGKIFCLDDAGTTHVLKAGPEFEVLARNKLDEQFWSSPAVSGGALILRGTGHIFCIKQ